MKDKHIYKPPTQEQIMLIEPKNVTFASYLTSEIQENILTLITDKLQNFITAGQKFNTDLFGQPFIEISCDEAGGRNSKAAVIREADSLRKKSFSFQWVHPDIHKTIETTGCIITSIHNVKKSNRVILNFNPWAIPFLLYYGVGVGGTRFSKSIALGLAGKYTKRIYKFLCSQRDLKEYYYSLSDFREDLSLPRSADNSSIKRDILEKAKSEIRNSGSDVWFDYELICRKPTKGRKPKADTIVFKIHSTGKQRGGVQEEMYGFVYRWIQRAMDYPTSNTPLRAMEAITEAGRLEEVHNRCGYYDDNIASGKMTTAHAQNSLLKMLREEFKINKPRKR